MTMTMTDQLWDAMVVLARRAKARRVKSDVEVIDVPVRRRSRPTTLHSIRETLAVDHYAMLAEAKY